MNTASLAKSFEDDAYYENVQAEHNDVSGFWVNRALYAAKNFLEVLGSNLFDDDVVADFGSRTGYVADMISRAAFVKPICVEIQQRHIDVCKQKGFESYCGRIENMHFLPTQSVDWGFCSHTLEHVKDYAAAVQELNRVVKRGLFIVVPMEEQDFSHKNPSHMRYTTDINEYIEPFERLGWKRGWECPPVPVPDDTRDGDEYRSDYQVWLHK